MLPFSNYLCLNTAYIYLRQPRRAFSLFLSAEQTQVQDIMIDLAEALFFSLLVKTRRVHSDAVPNERSCHRRDSILCDAERFSFSRSFVLLTSIYFSNESEKKGEETKTCTFSLNMFVFVFISRTRSRLPRKEAQHAGERLTRFSRRHAPFDALLVRRDREKGKRILIGIVSLISLVDNPIEYLYVLIQGIQSFFLNLHSNVKMTEVQQCMQ